MADSSSNPKRSTHMNSSARSTDSSSDPKRSTQMNSSAETSVRMFVESSSNPRLISSENFKKSGGMTTIEEYNADVETKDDMRYKKSADYISGRHPHDCAIKSSWNLKNSGEQTNPETEDVMKKSTYALITPTMICCNHCVHIPGRDLGRYPSQAALACKLCGWVLDNFILSSEITHVNGSGSTGGLYQYNDPTMDVSGRPMMVWCDRCSYVPARDSSDRALACKLCGWVLHNYILSPEVIYVENATARKKGKAALDSDQTSWETNDIDELDNPARKMMQSQTLLINQSQCGGSDHRIMSMNQQQQVLNMAQSNPSTSGGSAMHQQQLANMAQSTSSKSGVMLAPSLLDQSNSETNDVVENAGRKMMQSQTLLINQSQRGGGGSDHQIMSMNQQQQQVVNMAQSNSSTSGGSAMHQGSDPTVDKCGSSSVSAQSLPVDILLEESSSKKEKAALDTDQTTWETNDIDELDNPARKMMQSQTLSINQSQCGGSDYRIMSKNQQQQVFNMAQSNSSTSGGMLALTLSGSAMYQRRDPTVDNDGSSSVSVQSLPVEMLMEILDRVPPSKRCYQVCRDWRRHYRFRQRNLTILNPPVRFFPLSGRYFQNLLSLTLDYSLVDFPEPNETTGRAGGMVVPLVTDEDLATVAADFPGLQRLELLGCDVVTEAGLIHLAQECRRLAYLHLRDCKLVDDNTVLSVAKASQSLDHIEISLCEVTAAGIATLRSLTRRVSVRGCPRSEALRLFPHQI